jgi:hypothetical protein
MCLHILGEHHRKECAFGARCLGGAKMSMLANMLYRCLILDMTSTPEQANPEVESPVLSERLERVRNALVELRLAREELGIGEFSQEEIETAYIQARKAKLASRAQLDEADRTVEDYGKTPEYRRMFANWTADLDMASDLGKWVGWKAEEVSKESGDHQFNVDRAGFIRLDEIAQEHFDGRMFD